MHMSIVRLALTHTLILMLFEQDSDEEDDFSDDDDWMDEEAGEIQQLLKT